MLAGIKSSLGVETEKKSVFGATGDKLKAAGSKLAAGEIPTFQDESAFSKCCPNLTMKQAVAGSSLYWYMKVTTMQPIMVYLISCGNALHPILLVSQSVICLIPNYGTLVLIGGPTARNITVFAVLYVVGNVIALCATGFLLGPKTQCNKMWHVRRRYTTAFYLIMLIAVFAVAVAKQHVGIVLALLVIEVLAASWYGLSFIPFGRKVVIMFLRRTICKPCFQVYDSVKGSGGAKDGGLSSQATA